MNTASPDRGARLAFRQPARRLLQQPLDVDAHRARLRAAMELPGSEPVQGALADLFATFGVEQAEVKRTTLQLVRGRLAPYVAHWFEGQVNGAQLPRSTVLATRWSVLARPSTDISTRARRCSVDVSRVLADQVIASFPDETGDAGRQSRQEFLHHCLTCEDNLAFMLARRALLRRSTVLPPEWEAVSQQLENLRSAA